MNQETKRRRPIFVPIDVEAEPINMSNNDDELLSIEKILSKNISTPAILEIALDISRKIEGNINNLTSKEELLELLRFVEKDYDDDDDIIKEDIIRITFHNRYFDNMVIKNHGKLHGYMTKIIEHDGGIYKIFLYDCGNIPTSILITELAMQEYSSFIAPRCAYQSPELLQYGKYVLSDDELNSLRHNNALYRGESPDAPFRCLFYFKMTKLNYPTLHEILGKEKFNNESERKMLSSKITDVIGCMETNQLYHNDLNTSNILVNDNNDIGIIDYGQSSSDLRQLDVDFSSEKLASLKRYSPTTIGGQTRKYKRHRKTHRKKDRKHTNKKDRKHTKSRIYKKNRKHTKKYNK
jgi:hypothetical protein